MSSIVESVAPRQFTYDPSGSVPADAPPPDVRWSLVTRIAFRFCAIYVGLYVLTTQMLQALLPVPHLPVPNLGVIPPMRSLFYWIGLHLFGMAHVPSPNMTGSGDRAFDWLQAASLLVIAAVGTLVWSLIARRRQHHARLYRAFRAFVRLSIATTFLGYGFAKVIPQQMPPHQLRLLVEPFGNFSPMGVLWWSIAASPAYEICVGSAEVLGALLLAWPRTAAIGALVCLMDATQVFVLNMTYDVPVKLFAFHLVVFSLILLAPYAQRLFDLFLLHRRSSVPEEPPFGATARAKRAWSGGQLVYGLAIAGLNARAGVAGYHTYGAGAPKPALYGIWQLDRMTRDGADVPLVVTDSTLWRRLVVQRGTAITVQRMNDRYIGFGTTYDTAAGTITLTAGRPGSPASTLKYARPSKDRLLIDGRLDDHLIHLELSYRDPALSEQWSRGFHWVSPVPYQR
jgi:hypothetical protein